MTLHSFKSHALILGSSLLVPVSTALAHTGHGAPEVHAHSGSSSLLAVLAIMVLGIAALVPLARLVLRLRQRRQQR